MLELYWQLLMARVILSPGSQSSLPGNSVALEQPYIDAETSNSPKFSLNGDAPGREA
jgi:hypothetical protein